MLSFHDSGAACKTVKEAAKATHKRLRQVEFRTQGPDHPILWANSANVPESYYLKFSFSRSLMRSRGQKVAEMLDLQGLEGI